MSDFGIAGRVVVCTVIATVAVHWVLCMLDGLSGRKLRWTDLVPSPWPMLTYLLPIAFGLSFLRSTDDRSDEAIMLVVIVSAGIALVVTTLTYSFTKLYQLHAMRRQARFRRMVLDLNRQLREMILLSRDPDLLAKVDAFYAAAKIRFADLERADAEDAKTLARRS